MFIVNFSVVKTGKVEHRYEKIFKVTDVRKIWLELRDAVTEMLDYFLNRIDV